MLFVVVDAVAGLCVIISNETSPAIDPTTHLQLDQVLLKDSNNATHCHQQRWHR